MEKQWNILEPAPQEFLKKNSHYSPAVATMLFHRGLIETQDIETFLHPSYDTDLHDPFLFLDMQKTVERLFQAIEQDETITIHGDYDADGVSASTILTDTLEVLGAKHVNVYLPHRETDGYGLNTNTVQKLADAGTHIIITCDCGISNVEEVELANKLGLDVIITDHHSMPPVLPKAFAIIHPKREEETYPDKHLSGGGVAFKLAQALLHTHAKDHETLPNGEAHIGFEKWLLDMAAISSVADMVPLIGESRVLTKFGLYVLNKPRRIGLLKLYKESDLMHNDGAMHKPITETTIGFRIAPQINAAGRLEHANTAYKLMVAQNGAEAIDLAFLLKQQNDERRSLTQEFVAQAVEQIEKDQLEKEVLVVFGERWLTGISGLIASRLKETYQKPVIAMAPKSAKETTGSGRSVTGFNLIGAMQEIPEMFTKFGGHPMACGFSLQTGKTKEELQEKLCELYRKNTAGVDMTPTLEIEAEIPLAEVNLDLYDQLQLFAPFGQKNARPCFVSKGVMIQKVDAIGKTKTHLCLTLQDKKTGAIKKALGWGLCDDDRSEHNWCELLHAGDLVDIVFEIEDNVWNNNRNVQLKIVDLRKNN